VIRVKCSCAVTFNGGSCLRLLFNLVWRCMKAKSEGGPRKLIQLGILRINQLLEHE